MKGVRRGCVHPVSIPVKSPRITDARDSTAGTDINSQADFKLASLNFNGIGLLI